MKLNFGKRLLPSLLQAEAAECGLCCIAMIANYHGYHTDLVSMRRQFGMSLRGSTLRNLMDISEKLNLSPRPLRAELDELKKARLPAVLFWDMNHFVVLAKVTRSGVVIHDPAVGIRKYSFNEASKHFTGVVMELTPCPDFETGDDTDPLSIWTLFAGTRGMIGTLVQIFLLSLILQLFGLVSPFYMQTVVDDVLAKGDTDFLLVLTLGFAALTLISVATDAVRRFTSLYLVNGIGYNIGNRVFHHLIRLPMDYFEKRHMGDVMSRFGATGPIQGFVTGSVIAALLDGMLAMTTLTLMFWYSPILTFVVIGSIVLYAISRAILYRPLLNLTHEGIKADARLSSTFMESIRSLQGIKLASKEIDRQNTWRNEFVGTINVRAKIGRLTIVYGTANGLLSGIENLLVIYLAAQHVLGNEMTIGMVYAFMAYKSSFSGSVVSLIDLYVEYRMLDLHISRLSDITQNAKEPGFDEASRLILPLEGKLEAHNLSFKYAEGERPIFQGFSLVAEKGEVVAIVGPSGIGKTTLVKLLIGLLQPTEGELLVDGMSLRTFGQQSYRHHVAALMQDDTLFSGSLRDNVTFFDPTPDVEKAQQACQWAQVHDDIMQTPMGYDSLIGDMGSSLSRGQQQRVLIARALYREPKILFLDEGTAHVDGATEEKIFSQLRTMGTTCIYVTHNQNVLKFADKVITMAPQ